MKGDNEGGRGRERGGQSGHCSDSLKTHHTL